jgi:hypothetical protein
MMRRINDRGAAMPLAILWIALLSVGAVAGLTRLAAERRTTGNLEAEVDAFALAQGGIDRYLGTVTSPPGVSLDTTITDVVGGMVDISVRRLRAGGGGLNAMYVIRSTSSHTASMRYDASTPTASRTAAQFAYWVPGNMDVPAAWTSITGLYKHGSAGTIAGADQCGAVSNVAGVAVPTVAADGAAGYEQNGGGSVPSGSPPIVYPGADPADFASTIDVDWNGIVNGGALPADYNLTSIAGWPGSFTDWPTIIVNNAAELELNPGNSGRGLLVVRGNVTMNGSFDWDGLILIGGTLTSDGNQTIQGAVMTGLNVKLGESVAVSDMGNGNKTVQYNSCNVATALENLGALRLVKNGWSDNWPVY